MEEGFTVDELLAALAECRNAFPLPEPGSKLENLWAQAMGCPLSIPAYLREVAKMKS